MITNISFSTKGFLLLITQDLSFSLNNLLDFIILSKLNVKISYFIYLLLIHKKKTVLFEVKVYTGKKYTNEILHELS